MCLLLRTANRSGAYVRISRTSQYIVWYFDFQSIVLNHFEGIACVCAYALEIRMRKTQPERKMEREIVKRKNAEKNRLMKIKNWPDAILPYWRHLKYKTVIFAREICVQITKQRRKKRKKNSKEKMWKKHQQQQQNHHHTVITPSDLTDRKSYIALTSQKRCQWSVLIQMYTMNSREL